MTTQHICPLQEAVQVLLKHSVDVNARDKNWQTPLHIAAANKAVRCAEALVPLLSNVNVSDRAGRTALHHAAFSGHLEVGLCCCSQTVVFFVLYPLKKKRFSQIPLPPAEIILRIFVLFFTSLDVKVLNDKSG